MTRLFRRHLNRAVACLCTLAATSASAVVLSENGTGQVLLFPYYTVRGGTGISAFNTLVSVVNTANDTKAVRVRFREGKNGREVANYNILLAPLDTWTVALFPSDTATSAITRDSSCVTSSPASTNGLLQFTNADYSGSRADGEDTSPDRTREGFFEAIEMGVVTDPALVAAIANRHCPGDGATLATLGAPTGGLMGGASLVNVGAGTLYSFAPTVLDGFSEVPLYAPVDQGGPTLESVNPKIAAVHEPTGIRITHWDVDKGARPADPVSAVLMRQSIMNAFVLDVGTRSSTVWVIAMPTKSFYGTVGAEPLPPFQSKFGAGGAPESFGGFGCAGSGCATIGDATQIFDREAIPLIEFGDVFGRPPIVRAARLPWAVTTLDFNETTTNRFDSTVRVSARTNNQHGWMRLTVEPLPSRPSVHKLTSTDTPARTYYGLPLVGFMANDYANSTIAVQGRNVLSNYGETAPHRGVVRAE